MAVQLTGWDGSVSVTSIAVGSPTPGAINRAAQGFQIPSATNCVSLQIKVRNNGGQSVTSQFRIETDVTGQPSGTLVNANASLDVAAVSLPTATMTYFSAVFAASFALAATTPYWIVVKNKTEPGPDFTSFTIGFTSVNPYTGGDLFAFITNAYITATAGHDAAFAVFGPDPVGTIGGVDQNKMLMGWG